VARTTHKSAARSLLLAATLLAMPGPAIAQTSSDPEGAAAGLFAVGVAMFISAISCFIYAFVPLLALASTVIWVLALVDLAQRRDSEFPGALGGQPNANEKIVWLLIVLLAGAVGAVVYYVIVMKKYPRAPAVGTPSDR
jgi:hypothetical protein